MKSLLVFVIFFTHVVSGQNFTEYFTGSPSDLEVNPEFGICMMGGASENDNAMVWFLERANGGDVVVLRASGSDGYNDYFYTDLGVSLNSVTTFVINNENGATDPYVLQRVANAEAIWFAGGDQFDYVSFFKDNAMEDTLNNFINIKRGVIGGTSAGMAILGSAYFSAENGTVTNAQALSNPYHNRMTLGYNDFLEIPFLEHVITDTHYDDPDRRGRHSAFLARYANDIDSRPLGIACNEYTAVCIDDFGRAYVYGEYPDYPEFAYFLQSNCSSDFIPEICSDGQPLTWDLDGEAIQVAKIPGLVDGGNFIDLTDWSNGQGIIWENWTVVNGVFSNVSSENPNCDLLGIDDKQLLSISVYPNPFSDDIFIDVNFRDFEIVIQDSFGKVVETFENQFQLDTSNLSSGLYFLTVLDSEGRKETFKLIND